MRKLLPILSVALLAACSTTRTAETPDILEILTADLARGDGTWAGAATISRRTDGIFLSLEADAPMAGTFGMHIHAVGKCNGPAFTTAGAHWNPTSRQHGRDNPMGAHGGDLPNVVAAADRKLVLEQKLDDIKFEGEGGLLDADGAALVIHEKPDDYLTDPSGNSGKRIICGVLKSGNRSR